MTMNRRTFVAATMATGLAARLASAEAAAEPVNNYSTKDELPTPALLVDLDAFEANVKLMAETCKRTGCGFRPHAKTHKCPEIARRLVAAGALGASVATVPEAEALVAGGVRGVLLTSPIVERNKIARMVELMKKGGEVLLSISHPREVELLGEAAEANRVTLDVLVDVDVGDKRTGILPGQPAVDLALLIAKQKSLRLRGVQAYSGRSSHTKGFERRAKTSREAMTKAVETRDLIAKAGLDAPIVSGGSTGTYNIDSEIHGVTELQVGSFIFMDANYRAIGGKNGDAVYTDFLPSLFVLTTVVNTTHPELVSIDAGTKAFATDVVEKPEAKSWEGITYGRSGDEFGRLTAAVKGAKLPRLGDRLEFIVSHCDPTVNLYDRIYAMRGDRVEGVWAVAARREFHAGKLRT